MLIYEAIIKQNRLEAKSLTISLENRQIRNQLSDPWSGSVVHPWTLDIDQDKMPSGLEFPLQGQCKNWNEIISSLSPKGAKFGFVTFLSKIKTNSFKN